MLSFSSQNVFVGCGSVVVFLGYITRACVRVTTHGPAARAFACLQAVAYTQFVPVHPPTFPTNRKALFTPWFSGLYTLYTGLTKETTNSLSY